MHPVTPKVTLPILPQPSPDGALELGKNHPYVATVCVREPHGTEAARSIACKQKFATTDEVWNCGLGSCWSSRRTQPARCGVGHCLDDGQGLENGIASATLVKTKVIKSMDLLDVWGHRRFNMSQKQWSRKTEGPSKSGKPKKHTISM